MTSALAPPPADPVPAPPPRRPGSIRRTSTMLMSWPGGLGTELHLQARARDLLTPAQGDARVVAAAELTAMTGRERDIQSLEADPPWPRSASGSSAAAPAGPPQGHRGGAARRGRRRDPAPPPARRPGRRDADRGLRLLPLVETSTPRSAAHSRCAGPSGHGRHLLGLPTPGRAAQARRHALGRQQEHGADADRWPTPADPLGWHELPDHPDDRHAPGSPDRRVGEDRT